MDIRDIFQPLDHLEAYLRRNLKEVKELRENPRVRPLGSVWSGTWYFHHKDIAGNTLWKSVEYNALGHEGSESTLDVNFRAASAPSNMYIRLVNDTPVNTDHLSDLTGEASGSGYDPTNDGVLARSVVGWPTLAGQGNPNTYFKLSSKTCTFEASGGSWGPVTYAILASAATGTSGILFGFVALSQSRTLQNGDTMDISLDISLQ